eukprot:gene19875-21816_t
MEERNFDDRGMDDKFGAADEERSPSRKRPYRDVFDERRSGYQSYDGRRAEMLPLLKILVPNYAAGAIIGKGGHNISQLQTTYGAKIRLSQNNEYYPGSQERVAIITGDVDKVIDLHKYVMDRIRNEAHNQSQSVDDSRQRQSRGSFVDEGRARQVKIIVPNGTAGLLIGKGGSMIRNLMEQSGARIIISNKDHEQVPGERVVTISGTSEENEEACRLVIDKIATDPSNMMNRNLSYGTSQSFHRMEGNSGHLSGFQSGFNRQQGKMDNSLSALSSVLGNIAGNKNQQQNILASLGLSGSATGSISSSSGSLTGNNQFGLAGNPLSLAGMNTPSLPHIKTKVIVEMQIPDSLVGSILGKGGKTILEFINYSGAKIQFSSKGEFVPGTNDRLLTIEGDFTSSQIAHILICQKIVHAEADSAK